MTANQNIDQQSVREAIQSTLWAAQNRTKAIPAEYTLEAADPRRMVVRFPGLPEGTMVEFKVEGAKTDGAVPFQIKLPQDGLVITMWSGIAWSGLRWIDTAGRTVREHGFDSAAFVQPSYNSDDPINQQLLIYNRDQTVYRLDPKGGDTEDITIREWAYDQPTKYNSEYGVNTIYSYPDEQADLFYAAHGLQAVYKVNKADGTNTKIYESDRPIYGMAASPDGRHIAILVDSELNLGPSADLSVIDAKGDVVSEFPKAAYMGHSEGWHWIYPVRWTDNDTVAVPQIAGSAESHREGRALIHYKKGLLSKEEHPTLPEDAAALLKSEIEDPGEMEIMRVLPMPSDEQVRYYAVSLADSRIYLVNRIEKKVTPIGFGSLIMWTPEGQLIVSQSTEGKSAVYIGME